MSNNLEKARENVEAAIAALRRVNSEYHHKRQDAKAAVRDAKATLRRAIAAERTMTQPKSGLGKWVGIGVSIAIGVALIVATIALL